MKDKEIVRTGYNNAAEEYLAVRHENLPEMKILIDFSKRLQKGCKILDAGCGAGLPFTKFLSDKFEVIGIDLSEKQIELARTNVPNARFECQDMTKLSFQDETFDAIVSYYAIIHIPREEHYNLFENFFRILKPKGLALLCLHQSDDPGSYEEDFFGAKMFWSGFDWKTNLEMLEKIGFNIVWHDLVSDSLSEDSGHLFVIVQK